MPNEDDPNAAVWKAALFQATAGPDDGAVLAGHSMDGTILIDAIAEGPTSRRFAGIFLFAARFVGAWRWPSDGINPTVTVGGHLPLKTPSQIFHRSADEIAPLARADLDESARPAAHGVFPDSFGDRLPPILRSAGLALPAAAAPVGRGRLV